MQGETVQITDIKYPEDGWGIYTHLDHYKHPYKGYPDERVVDKNAIMKRCILSIVKRLMRPPFIFVTSLFFILPSKLKRKILWEGIVWVSELYGTAFRKHFPDEKRLCPSARELNRVGELLIKDIQPEGSHRIAQDALRTILLIWEFDNSYRYRGQDVFSELNKEALKQNPRKEIVRLFKLGLSRERAGLSQKDLDFLRKLKTEVFDTNMKWKLMIKAFSLALLFSKDILRFCTLFLENLDVEKMKPDEGDWYWMCERCDYDFKGQTFTERLLWRLRTDEDYFKALPPQSPPQAQLAMIPNDEFFSLEKPQAENIINGLLKQVWEAWETKRKAEGLTT